MDENTLQRVRTASAAVKQRNLLGSELIAGISMEPGDSIIGPAGKAPYAQQNPARVP